MQPSDPRGFGVSSIVWFEDLQYWGSNAIAQANHEWDQLARVEQIRA